MKKMDPSLKALQILETLSDSGKEGMGITDLATKSGLTKSTAHRIVNALVEAGYLVRKDATKTYTLGFRILHVTASLMDSLEIKEVARPYLNRLWEESKETVHLVQLDGLQAVYIDKIDTPHTIGLLSKVGKRLMLHSTATGKIFLAYMSPEERQKIYTEAGLPQRTPHTLCSIPALEEELDNIKNKGYAIDRMENKEGIYCIAGPIFSENGQVINSFSISGPSFRFTEKDVENLAVQVKETSYGLSRDLVQF
ncbi:IclR family transcriptional regulator [Salibacterium aidingense]|uniref:IclR family transcriptional regulator n=1 Tax=Salibacterium aidingense TaxID=384933 RepID=UPI0003FFB808|nr:IclR family transcriptional regulator [Salibacterium aidingense]